jgi:hypothetical protein
MITVRLAAISCAAVLFAACSSGAVSTTPLPAATATATAAATSATLTVGGSAAQALPAANGATATVSIAAAAGTPATASVAVTASTTPPAGIATLGAFRRAAQAVTRLAEAYYTFVPSVDMQLLSFPAFTLSFPVALLPAGTTVHEAYLDGSTAQPLWTYDIAVGANGSTLTSTALAPKLIAGKSYVFAFYIETGSAATPSPSPSSAPTATAAPTSSAAPLSDITVPASISTAPVAFTSVSDPAFFNGFVGTHFFGRGGKGAYNGDTPTLINDCNLTVANSTVTVTGGGGTVTAPFLSTNPNYQTLIAGFQDTLHLGGSEIITFYDGPGAQAINVVVFAGRVVGVAGGKSGLWLSCSSSFASNMTTDRTLDTLTFSAATLASMQSRATGSLPATLANLTAADLGGAAGSIAFGRGQLSNGTTGSLVTDCALTISGGTLTLTGGTFSQTATLTGAASDSVKIVAVQGSPTQYAIEPQNGLIIMYVNNFGNVYKAQGRLADGTALLCPI